MACSFPTYAPGYAGCCRCEYPLDLASAPVGASIQYGGIDLYFFFCSRCSTHLEAAGGTAQAQAVLVAIEKAQMALPKRTRLAVTSSIALQAHGGDLVRAYEIGVDMPRPVHDAIVSGDLEAVFPPSGREA